MPTKIGDEDYNFLKKGYKDTLKFGFKNEYVFLYDDKLINKLRNIYERGVPASLLLLSNCVCFGKKYDRSLLLARAFMEDQEDFQIVYASIESLRTEFRHNIGDLSLDVNGLTRRYLVERTTTDGEHYIYDPFTGLLYDKDMYEVLEKPKIVNTMGKDSIDKYIKCEMAGNEANKVLDEHLVLLLIPYIEKSYDKIAKDTIPELVNMLKDEVNYFKELLSKDDFSRGKKTIA